MSEEDKKKRKRFNLEGLLEDRMPDVVRAVELARLKHTPEDDSTAEETAKRLIEAAWNNAAIEVSEKRTTLGFVILAGGIACCLAASNNAGTLSIVVPGIAAYVVGLLGGYYVLHEASKLLRPQYNPEKNNYKPYSGAWESKKVYKNAENRIGQMLLNLK